MAEAPRHPELVAVDGGGAPSGSVDDANEGERRRGALPWVLAVIAVILAVSWLSQLFRANELSVELGILQAELVTTQAAVSAYQDRMDEVRGSVFELSDRLDVLSSLVSEDPRPVGDDPDAGAP